MTGRFRIAAFAGALALASAAAAVAGAAIEPKGADDAAPHADDAAPHGSSPGSEAAHGGPDPVRGLAVAEDGLRVEVASPELRRGATEQLRFRVLDERGRTVRDFDVAHEKRMHLILARRDLTGFQHLHPRLGEDGVWSAPVRLDDAGSYRLFADFTRDGEAHTLAADLRVDGAADLRELPASRPGARTDTGYDVRIDGGPTRAGVEAELRFSISRAGQPVDVEQYLGAGGHLVALREGDLAFLHVHPTDGLGFEATFPTPGRYRLFLQFKHHGRVHTAAFTQVVR